MANGTHQLQPFPYRRRFFQSFTDETNDSILCKRVRDDPATVFSAQWPGLPRAEAVLTQLWLRFRFEHTVFVTVWAARPSNGERATLESDRFPAAPTISRPA